MRKNSLNKRETDRALENSIKDGSATGAASGMISTYLTPFALALGVSAAQIGLLTAVPQLISTLMQPLAGTFTEHAESRKNICKVFMLIARLAWIPVMLLSFARGFDTFALLLLFVSVSAAAASFARLAWTSWIGELVPEKIRGRYFGKRNMFIGAASFISVLLAGWILVNSDTMAGFALIFLSALILYFVGMRYLMKMPEPSAEKHKMHRVPPNTRESKAFGMPRMKVLSIYEFLSSLKKSNFRHFMLFSIFFDFSVYLAAPFFTVYMISELQVGYLWFAVISAASILAGLLSQKYWGRLSDKYGDKNIMVICAALTSFFPLIMVFSRSVPLLVLANVFSGFAWAGFDLAVFNFLLDSSPPLKRPLFISNYQFFDGLAVVGGSIAGGTLIYLFGSGFFWLSAISAVFLLSFALRAIFSLALIPRIREERIKRKTLSAGDVFKRAVVLYPARGISHEIDYAHRCLSCWEEKVKKEMKGAAKVVGVA
ncbi:MAG: MFS transporter [Candidatus Aenigmatarchaeota archaeon]